MLQIKEQSIESLIPYSKNARTHSDEQVQQIANSITSFGFNNPVLVDGDNNVIAGHGRLMAGRSLGLTHVPTITLDHLTAAQRKAYILADNKIALNAGWSLELLKDEFEDMLSTGDVDLGLTGFDSDEINAILNPEILNVGESDPDEIAEPQGEPVTQLGDVWLLGNHRVMCGDSTYLGEVETLMNGHTPHLMVTDPPYGVNYNPEWRDGADLGIGERSKGKVLNDDKADWTDAYSLFGGDVVYVWHAGVFSPDVATHLANCGFDIVSQIIWVKQHFALSRGDYHWQHEPCWYAVRKGKKHNWQGARDQATTWDIKNNNAFGNANTEETWGHGTQKPVECMLRPIQNNSAPNQIVYDPFGGSGTTLIAAEKLGRVCHMMELSPAYCDVIVRRWQKFANNTAFLESTQQSFDEVANG